MFAGVTDFIICHEDLEYDGGSQKDWGLQFSRGAKESIVTMILPGLRSEWRSGLPRGSAVASKFKTFEAQSMNYDARTTCFE